MTARPDRPVPCPECHGLDFYVVRDPKGGVVTVECSACRHPLLRVAEDR